MSEDDDPFEELESATEGREDDPFERLERSKDQAEEGDVTNSWEQMDSTDRHPSDSPGESTDEGEWPAGTEPPERGESAENAESAEQTPSTAEMGTSDESSQMALGVGREKADDTDPFMEGVAREGDPFDQPSGPFEEMDTGGVDPDEVWQDLASAQSRGSVGKATERSYADVSKHSFCEQCEHFTEPPEVSCTHEGTEIVEFLDMETVRVVDCPVVAEREALEEGTTTQ